MMRGASGMLANDLRLAFASQPAPLLDSLVQAADTARTHIDGYVTWLEAR